MIQTVNKFMIQTVNKFLVGMQAGKIRITNLTGTLTPDEALLLAAWLVAMAEHEASHDFDDVLLAVKNA